MRKGTNSEQAANNKISQDTLGHDGAGPHGEYFPSTGQVQDVLLLNMLCETHRLC